MNVDEVMDKIFGEDVPNDFSLLRPFDLRLVSQGDDVCDTRGREVSLDAATEMMAQLGPSSLRMAPSFWLEGKPVYWDSEVLLLSGDARRYCDVPDGAAIISWPPEKKDKVVKIFVDGELAGSNTIPHDAVLLFWDLRIRRVN